MKVEEFHQTRQMFLITEDGIINGPKDSPMSHKEWFRSIGLDADKTIQENVRGFADERGIFFYRGKDFEVTAEDEEVFFQHLFEIQAKLGLPDDTQVFGGVVKTRETRYPPKMRYGAIKDCRKKSY